MVARTLHDRDGTGIAHRETLARDAAEVTFSGDRAVKHRIADDHRVFRHDLLGRGGRIDDEAPSRQTLADVVVGLAFEFERHAVGHPGPEALACRALELDVDRPVRQTLVAVTLGDHARQHGAGRSVRVLDRQCQADRGAVLDRLATAFDQRAVEHAVETVILAVGLADPDALRRFGFVEQPREVEPLGFPVVDHRRPVQHLHLADHVLELAVAELRHPLAHFFGDEEEVVDDVFGQPDEALAQHGVLRRDSDRAGVQVALAHHDAAGRDQRCGREAEFVRTQQRPDDDVAPRPQAAVDLHRNARAQPVDDERLVGFGKPDLPGGPGMFDRRQRRRARAALEARDRHMVGASLGHAGRNRADPDLGHELDRHQPVRVDVLQVEDQLRQILDRIDVVVRRRRDEAHARGRVPHPGDGGIDLVAG